MCYLRELGKRSLIILFLTIFVVGCSGGGGSDDSGPTEFTVSGTVSGLAPGNSVVLQNNAGDNLVVLSNGDFSFSLSVSSGSQYNVTVLTQPSSPAQNCVISGGSGTVNQNISSVLVECTTNSYLIGGSVSGLAGSGLVLQNNGGDNLPISANGEFSFVTAVDSGEIYNVVVDTQPNNPSQTCEIANGSGDVTDHVVNSVSIICTTNTYTIGGQVTGLFGSGLVLQNNNSDDLLISGNGNFIFTTEIFSGENYSVSVLANPDFPSQNCVVVDGGGSVTDQNITSIGISCSTYQIGVTVSGLSAGDSITLQNNGGDDLVLNANGGPFVFNTLLHDFLPYDVTVSVQPSASTQQCMVVNGSGIIASDNVTDIAIICPVLSALYPANGENWNDYVNNNAMNGFLADDTACSGSGQYYSSCLHGGEMRSIELVGLTSCSEITADDDLGAFNWVCEESAGVARIISTSLKDDSALSTLIDFSVPDWLENAVTINKAGNPVAKTPAGKWWSNPVVESNVGGSLNTAGTIYVVTVNPYANYTIDADKVGFVSMPGIELLGGVGSAVIYINGYKYEWIQTDVNGSETSDGVRWEAVAHSVIHNSFVRNARYGRNIYLVGSYNNKLGGFMVTNAISHGVLLEDSDFNTLVSFRATNSADSGVYLSQSDGNLLMNFITANNDNGSNATGGGVFITNSLNTRLINAVIANNKLSGVTISNSPNTLLKNIVGANNYTSFYISGNSNDMTVENLVSANNLRHGIFMFDSSNNYFTGYLKVGSNGGDDCRVEGSGVASGIINYSCSDTGMNGSSDYSGQLSDAILRTDVSTSLSFVGKVQSDDSVNTSDLNGGASYSVIDDWQRFENSYRMWGLDGNVFPSGSNGGPFPGCENYAAFTETDCVTNGGVWRTDGRIWDWSITTADNGDNGQPVLYEVLSLPNGDDVVSHEWSDMSSTVFLRNAVEIMGDAIGDDDGLCNSNESCLYTSNIGSYQGHGELVRSGVFEDSIIGGITGVRIYQYESNGF